MNKLQQLKMILPEHFYVVEYKECLAVIDDRTGMKLAYQKRQLDDIPVYVHRNQIRKKANEYKEKHN